MPQDESPEVKEARRQMRAGREPLLEAVKQAYKPYLLSRKGLERKNAEIREQVGLLSRKGLERKNAEIREQVGLLSSEFDAKCKQLRESSRKSGENPAAMVEMYRDLERQATSVAAMINKELPALEKLYGPVSKAFATYQGALDAHDQFMATWRGKLPESDFSGRALELVQQEIEKSLR